MTLPQMRRASIKMNLQGPRSAATFTIKTCLCLPPDALSLVLQPIAIHRTHLHPHTNPHSRVRGTSPAQSPAGSFLGGFRTPANAHLAPSFTAGIRNPQQKQTTVSSAEAALAPNTTDPRTEISFEVVRLRQRRSGCRRRRFDRRRET